MALRYCCFSVTKRCCFGAVPRIVHLAPEARPSWVIPPQPHGIEIQMRSERGHAAWLNARSHLLISKLSLGAADMLDVAYFGALRVSELAGLTWSQVIPRETGEAQLAIVGKGDKPRNILIPADLAAALRELRGDAPELARVFLISERRINYIVKATAKRAGINLAVSAHWLRHAHASHAIDEGAPITLVSQTLGHADLKTTSVYAHARPNDSSSRYLKRT